MPTKATEAALTVAVNVDTSEIENLKKEIKNSYNDINKFSNKASIGIKTAFQSTVRSIKSELSSLNLTSINKDIFNQLSVASDGSEIDNIFQEYTSSVNNFISYLKKNNLSEALFKNVDANNMQQYFTYVNKLAKSNSATEIQDISSKLTEFNNSLVLQFRNIKNEYEYLTHGLTLDDLDATLMDLEDLDTLSLTQRKNFIAYLQRFKELYNSTKLSKEDMDYYSDVLSGHEDFAGDNLTNIIGKSSQLKQFLYDLKSAQPYFNQIEELLSSTQNIKIDLDKESILKVTQKIKDIFGQKVQLSKLQFHSSKDFDESEVSSSADNLANMSLALHNGKYYRGGEYDLGYGTLSGTALYVQTRADKLLEGSLGSRSDYILIDASKLENSNLFRPKTEEDALTFAKNQADLQAYVIKNAYGNNPPRKGGDVEQAKELQGYESAIKGYEKSGSPDLDTLFKRLKKSYYGDFISKDEFNSFVSEMIDNLQAYITETDAKKKKELGNTDNVTALLNKKLGYNGVDVSGYTAVDNYHYGSGFFEVNTDAIIAKAKSAEELISKLMEVWNEIVSFGNIDLMNAFKEANPIFKDSIFKIPSSNESFNETLSQIIQPENSSSIEVNAKISDNAKQQLKDEIDRAADELSDENATVKVSVGTDENAGEELASDVNNATEQVAEKTDDVEVGAEVSDEAEAEVKKETEEVVDKAEQSTDKIEVGAEVSDEAEAEVKKEVDNLTDKVSDNAESTVASVNADEFKKQADAQLDGISLSKEVQLVPTVSDTFQIDAQAEIDKRNFDIETPVLLYPKSASDFEYEAAQNLPNITLPIKIEGNIGEIASLTGEESSFSGILSKVQDLISAIKQKNDLLYEEIDISGKAGISESADFETVKKSVDELRETLKQFNKLMGALASLSDFEEKIKSIKISKSLIDNLNNLAEAIQIFGTKLKNFEKKEINLSNVEVLSSQLKSLPTQKSFAQNLGTLGDAIKEFGESLGELNADNASSFLKQIDSLLSRSRELENLAKIFSNYKKIKNVSSAVNGTATLDDLYSQKSTKLKRIKSLEGQKSYSDFSKNKRLDTEIAYFEDEIYDLDKQINDTVGGSQKLAEYNNEKKKEISYLEEELGLKRELNDLSDKQKSSNNAQKDAANKTKQYYSQLAKYYNQIKTLTGKKKNSSGVNDTVTNQYNDAIENEIAKYKNEIQALETAFNNGSNFPYLGSSELIAQGEKEVSQIKEQIQLTENLHMQEQARVNTQAEINDYYSKIAQRLNEIKTATQKKKTTSGSNDTATEQFNSDLDQYIEAKRAELEALEKEVSNKMSSNANWQAQSDLVLKNQEIVASLKQQVTLTENLKTSEQTRADAKAQENVALQTASSYYKEIESYLKYYRVTTSKKDASLMSSDELNILKEYKAILSEFSNYKTGSIFESGTDWKSSTLTDADIVIFDKLISKLKELKIQYQSLSAYEKGTSDTKIEKFLNKIYTYMGKNTKAAKAFRTELETLIAQTKAAGKDVNLDEMMDQFLKIENAAASMGLTGNSFIEDFKKQANYTLSSFLSQYLSIQDVIRYAQSAISTIEDLDYALLDLSKTADMTEEQLNEFYYSANDSAKELGVTTEDIIDLASSWSRLGYNTNEEATKMAELTAKFAAISPGSTTDEAQTGMINVAKAWDMEASDLEDVIDKINVLGKKLPKRMVTCGAFKCA